MRVRGEQSRRADGVGASGESATWCGQEPRYAIALPVRLGQAQLAPAGARSSGCRGGQGRAGVVRRRARHRRAVIGCQGQEGQSRPTRSRIREMKIPATTYFPRELPPSIFGAGELNFRVRDGNGWSLSASVTGIIFELRPRP